jgi:type IV secretory pathway TraG/TraD family ATPase VirD4
MKKTRKWIRLTVILPTNKSKKTMESYNVARSIIFQNLNQMSKIVEEKQKSTLSM